MKKDIAVSDFIIKKDAIWCTSLLFNYVFQVDKNNGKIQNMFRIPYSTFFLTESIKYIVDYDEDNILLPSNIENIVYKFNVKQKCFHVFEDNFLCKMRKVTEVIKDKVYAVDGETNLIYEYNLLTFEIQTYFIGENDDRFIHIQKIGIYLIILTSEGVIYEWNNITKEKFEVLLPSECVIVNKNYSFSTLLKIDDITVWMFPQYANMIIEINLQDHTCSEIEIGFKNIVYNRGQIFTSAYVIDEKVWAYSQFMSEWSIWDYSKKIVRHAKSILDDWSINRIYSESIIKNPYKQDYVFLGNESNDISLKKIINDLIGLDK